MSDDREFDLTETTFTLSCPGYPRRGDGARPASRNLFLMLGDEIMAEIGHDDLIESWQAASALTAAELLKMTETAGRRLADIMESGLDSGDLTEAVTDAAVLFLLAMRRHGIADVKRIPACTVRWNGQEGREHVYLGA